MNNNQLNNMNNKQNLFDFDFGVQNKQQANPITSNNIPVQNQILNSNNNNKTNINNGNSNSDMKIGNNGNKQNQNIYDFFN